MANPLLTLMRSLSGPEKRYCHLYLKTFSGKKGCNNLLDDFLKADELSRRSKQEKKKITYKSNSTKLYYKVLDILHQYHSNSELFLLDEDALNIRRSKILYSKGFYEEADKMLTKVILKENENTRLRKIEAIEMKLEHVINKGDVEYLSEKFADDKDRLLTFFNEYYNIIEYQSLWAMLKLETTTSFFSNNLQNDKFANYSRLLVNEDAATTPKAKTIYFKIKGFIAINNNDVKSALELTKKSIAIFEANPNLLKSEPEEYFRAVRNLCISYKFNGELKKAISVLEDIEKSTLNQLDRSKAEVQVEYFYLFVILKMDLTINIGEIDKIEPELKSLEQKFKEMEELLSEDQKITTMFHLSIINIYLGYSRKALRFNNYVKEHAGVVRKDLYHIALMNELLIHYRLSNLQLLESKALAFKRFIGESGTVFGFEKKIPEYFISLINSPKKTTNYQDLQSEIMASLKEEKKMVYEKFIPFINLKKIN